MPIQYGPPTQIIRYGSGSAGSAPQPLLAGSFASAFSRKPAAAAKRKPASSAAPVSQTLAQVANQRVNQQLNPQIAAQNAFNAQQNQVIQSFANSLLGKLQPIAGQVGASYDSAIGQQGALANQAAQFLSNANPTGQVHDLLASINAPQEQQTQLANQFGQTFGGGAGVLSFTGGAIPGGQLAAEKAAAVGEASQLPGFAALKGQQDLASALWQQGQDRRTLEAQRPALYQAAAQDIRQNNQARRDAGATAQYRAQTLGQSVKDRQERIHEYNQNRQDAITRGATAAQAKVIAQRKQDSKDFLSLYFGGKLAGLSEDQVTQVAKSYGVDIHGVTAPAAQTKPIIKSYANGTVMKIDPVTGIPTITHQGTKPAAPTPKVDHTLSAAYHHLVDTAGNPILDANKNTIPYTPPAKTGSTSRKTIHTDHGTLIQDPKSPGGWSIVPGSAPTKPAVIATKKPLTPATRRKETDRLSFGIQHMKDGWTEGPKDPNPGKVHPAISREDALTHLHAEGYFTSPQYAQLAIAVLNRIYGKVATAKSSGGLGVTAQATP